MGCNYFYKGLIFVCFMNTMPVAERGEAFGRSRRYKISSSDRREYLDVIGIRREIISGVDYSTFCSIRYDFSALINQDDFSFFRSKIPTDHLKVWEGGILVPTNSWISKAIYYDENGDHKD